MINVLLTIIAGAAFAEFFGFLTHILLHSNKIEYLSRNHMIHHLVLYGPKKRMRSKKYLSPLVNRTGIFGVGFEWLIPVGLVAVLYGVVFYLIRFPLDLAAIFYVVNIIWIVLFYDIMHHAMHIQDFWMIKNKWLGKWFVKIRSLHDIHHIQITDDGRMNKNYGICFFMLDKIFGTFSGHFKPFNERGYEAAEKRYEYIYKELHKKESP